MAKQTGLFPFSGRIGNAVGDKNGFLRIFTEPTKVKTPNQLQSQAKLSAISHMAAGVKLMASVVLGGSWISKLNQYNYDRLVMVGSDASNSLHWRLQPSPSVFMDVTNGGNGLYGAGTLDVAYDPTTKILDVIMSSSIETPEPFGLPFYASDNVYVYGFIIGNKLDKQWESFTIGLGQRSGFQPAQFSLANLYSAGILQPLDEFVVSVFCASTVEAGLYSASQTALTPITA